MIIFRKFLFVSFSKAKNDSEMVSETEIILTSDNEENINVKGKPGNVKWQKKNVRKRGEVLHLPDSSLQTTVEHRKIRVKA